MSMTQSDSVFIREVIWVQVHPKRVTRVRLGKAGGNVPNGIMLTSVAAALLQTRPNGERHVAVRDDGDVFDFQPGKMALEHLGIDDPSMITVLLPEAYDEFAPAYMAGVGNLDALQRLVPAIEKHVPAFRFLPKNLHSVVLGGGGERGDPYRHVPRMFLRYDFRDYEALVMLAGSMNQVSPKRFVEWGINEDNTKHVGGGWYAFRSMDEAVHAKLSVPGTRLFELGVDDAYVRG